MGDEITHQGHTDGKTSVHLQGEKTWINPESSNPSKRKTKEQEEESQNCCFFLRKWRKPNWTNEHRYRNSQIYSLRKKKLAWDSNKRNKDSEESEREIELTCWESLDETSSSTPEVAKHLFDSASYRILNSLHLPSTKTSQQNHAGEWMNNPSETPAVVAIPEIEFRGECV